MNLYELILSQLCILCTKITLLPQRCANFRACAQKAFGDTPHPVTGTCLCLLMVVRDVKTRWNYTHAMIKRGYTLRKAIDTWCLHYAPDFHISTLQWKVLDEICKVLEVSS
jgi:hypothetical protein